MDERDFGAKIKARREELGLSQQDLAIALDLDQGKISLIEKGMRRIDLITELPSLAKALQCPVSWFFNDPSLPEDKFPMKALIEQYFPDVEFSEFEIKRIAQFIEPIIQMYVQHDPEFQKKSGLTTKRKRRIKDVA